MDPHQQLVNLAKSGDVKALKAALDSSGPGPLSHQDGLGRYLLHWSTFDPSGPATLELIRTLFPDQDIDSRDEMGYTPLLVCAENGTADTARKLIELRASPLKKTGTNSTALHYAASVNKLDMCMLLSDAAADAGDSAFHNSLDRFMDTALHLAAKADGDSVVSFLLSLPGVDMDGQNGDWNTPLHHAIIFDHLESAKHLITAGAKMDIINKEEKQALQLASPELRRALEEHFGWS